MNLFRFSIIKYLIICTVAFLCVTVYAQTINYDIRLNQVGFYPNLEKRALVPASATTFSIQTLDHSTTVFTGAIATSNVADFSSFTTPGNYVLYVTGVGYSAPFKIHADVFKDLSEASIKGYYYKRASTAITAEHGGVYARAAGHPDTQVMIHEFAASPGRPAGTIVSSPKGWYDAGDYNCYVVNSNISTYTLLAAYEHFSSYYDTLNLNIPESGNGMPDILNEIKWNLDWMLTMQDPYDGGVYDKKTTANFSEFIMPEEDKAQRYLVGKSSGATYGFAAVMAVAYRTYLPYDAVFANQCLEAAKRAFSRAGALHSSFINPPDITTGQYGSSAGADQWAATELYISTKNELYYPASYKSVYGFSIPSWFNVHSLSILSLVHHRKNLTAVGFADTTAVKNVLVTIADGYSSYKNSGGAYVELMWGSNSTALNAGAYCLAAYLISKDQTHLNGAISQLDYVLGKNPTTYCFVSGFGSKKVMYPHDRISASDGVTEPIPGWVAGGPTSDRSSNCASSPTGYIDLTCSYSTNEVAINWNAPLVFLSAGLQYVSRTDFNPVVEVFNGSESIASNTMPALTFGSALINTAAGEVSITIKNSGAVPLVISSITTTTGFGVSGLSSASPIAPGATSVFTITATPTNLGLNTGVVKIKTNDLGMPEFVLKVNVKGKPDNKPLLYVSNGTVVVASDNNPPILLGSSIKGITVSPLTITLTNEGSAPLIISSITSVAGFEISALSKTDPIDVDASATFTITATPLYVGVNEGFITIETNDPLNQKFLFHVVVKGLSPVLSLYQNNILYVGEDAEYSFPGTTVQGSQSAPVEFRIKNTGTSLLTFEQPVLTGPFQLSGEIQTSLNVNEETTFTLIFNPVDASNASGNVVIASNVEGPSFKLNLSGTGIIPLAPIMKVTQGSTIYTSNGSVLEFPVTIQGSTSNAEVITITNTGNAALSISDLTLTGPFELSQAFTATSIAAGGSKTFSVVFKPVSITTAAGNAIITSNVTGSPFILKFSGTGTLATGTVGLLASDAILISPNPTKQDIAVKIDGTFSNVSVNVYNALGEHVLTKELGSVEYSSFPLSLSDVASGMYMLEIITDQGMSMKRIVKE